MQKKCYKLYKNDKNIKQWGIKSELFWGIEGAEPEGISKLPGKDPLLWHKKWGF